MKTLFLSLLFASAALAQLSPISVPNATRLTTTTPTPGRPVLVEGGLVQGDGRGTGGWYIVTNISGTNTFVPAWIAQTGGLLTGASSLAQLQDLNWYPLARRQAGQLAILTNNFVYQLNDLTLTNWSLFSGIVTPQMFGCPSNYMTNRWVSSGPDVSSYFQAAANFLGENGGGILQVPPGNYRIDSTVTIPPRVHLVGTTPPSYNQNIGTNNVAIDNSARFFRTGTNTIFSINSASSIQYLTNAQIISYTALDGSYVTNYAHGGTISKIMIDGLPGEYGPCIMIDRVVGATVDQVAFNNTKGIPIYVYGCVSPIIRHAVGLSNKGIFVFSTSDLQSLDFNIGGARGPMIWFYYANKNQVADSFFFNQNDSISGGRRQTFTVDTVNDTITIPTPFTSGQGWQNGDPVTLESEFGATMPSPLTTNSVYFIIRVSDTVFKLNTQYTQGAVGGALQGVGLDLTTAGSGVFTVGQGPDANIYLHDTDQNAFTGVRNDQAAGDGVLVRFGEQNSFVGGSSTEWGFQLNPLFYTERQTNAAAFRFLSSNSNIVSGNIVRVRSGAVSFGKFGVFTSGGSGNEWSGPLPECLVPVSSTGASEIWFNGGVNSWGDVLLRSPATLTATNGFPYIPKFANLPTSVLPNATGQAAVAYDTSQNKSLYYNGSAWRQGLTFSSSDNVQVTATGTLSYQPASGEPMQIHGQSVNSIASLFSYSNTAGDGSTITLARAGGTRSSPTGVTNGFELGSVIGWGRHSSGNWIFSNYELVWTATEDYTSTAGGNKWELKNTPNGTASRRTVLSGEQDGNVRASVGDLQIMTPGKGLQIKEGSNARMGSSVLVGGTVTVANTSVTANSRVLYSRGVPGGTLGELSCTQIPATSFTILSTSGTETSTVTWLIVEPSP